MSTSTAAAWPVVVATVRVAELAAIAIPALFPVPLLAVVVAVVVVPIALRALVAPVVSVVMVPVLVVPRAHRRWVAHAPQVVRRLCRSGRSEQASTTSRVRRVAAQAQRRPYVNPAA